MHEVAPANLEEVLARDMRLAVHGAAVNHPVAWLTKASHTNRATNHHLPSSCCRIHDDHSL
eukprot:5938397-Karenia_brevis.AAC.1